MRRTLIVLCAAAVAMPGIAHGDTITIPTLPVGGVTTPASSSARPAAGGTTLAGTFRITAGTCSGAVTGSYFRMIQPGGSRSGPFVQNSDSPCGDKTYTPMAPGTDGGLVTGTYQPQPNPPFDSTGNGKANRVTKPAKFYGVDFATATNEVDPQTGKKVTAPRIESAAGKLSGDLRGFAASWNNQHFNQGAPKPDGTTPGTTAGPTGTYDASTGKFVLEWTSQIVGGPFNNFTGSWHLEGTFAPASSATVSAEKTSPDAPAAPGSAAATPPAPAASSTSGGSTTGSTASGATLAHTGSSLPSWPGALLVALGIAGLRLRRRGPRRA